MSKKLNDLKKTERDFRGLVSNLFNTEWTDGLFHLIKFNTFIHDNKEIKKIISKFDDPTIDISNFVMKGSTLLYTQFDKPLDDSLHYKYILKYINQLIENNTDLKQEFSYYKREKNYNNAIQTAFKDLISPLYTYIIKELISKIEQEEDKEKKLEQKPVDVYMGDVAKDGGVVNKAGHDIASSNNNSTNIAGENIIQENNNIKIKKKFYQKEGFWTGVISGIIVGLAVWGIQELIKFLINL